MLKKNIGYLPFLLVLGFIAIMQFTSYEKVDQLPLLKGKGIEWSSDNFVESLARARKEEKLVFVDFYAKWCRPCKMLKSVTFPRESVGEMFNSNFVNLTIDVESPEGKKLAQQYQITSYPSLLILDTEGKQIAKKVGFMIPFQLNNWAENMLER